jgi:hypothetical protein
VLHELPAGSHIVVCDPERVRTRAAELVRTSEEFLQASWAAAAGGGTAPIDLGAAALRTVEQARDDAASLGIPWWTLSPFAADVSLGSTDALAIDATPAEEYRGDTDRATADAREWTRDGWRVAMVFEGHGPAMRAVEQLGCGGGAGTRRAPRCRPCRSRASSPSPPACSPAASSPGAQARRARPGRHHRPARPVDPRHAADAVPAPAQRGRPARTQAR